MISIQERVNSISADLKKDTDSTVIHLQALRKAIGYIALGLPFALAIGENIRDKLVTHPSTAGARWLEGSVSAYYHTGMREVFVGSLFAIGVFLVCYKGYERRDDIAANIAGFCAFFIAFFPTHEPSVEATDTAARAPDSVTFFSGADAPDPTFVGYVHFISATIFFITLAVMSLFLFTLSTTTGVTPAKKRRNRVYVTCGVLIILSIAAIAIVKFATSDALNERTSLIFWLETVAIVAFGASWLTKAQVWLGDPS